MAWMKITKDTQFPIMEYFLVADIEFKEFNIAMNWGDFINLNDDRWKEFSDYSYWMLIAKNQPERSKRENSQCEMRCSEHCGNTVREAQ